MCLGADLSHNLHHVLRASLSVAGVQRIIELAERKGGSRNLIQERNNLATDNFLGGNDKTCSYLAIGKNNGH